MRRDAFTGQIQLTVDGTTVAMDTLVTAPRNVADLVFGSLAPNLRYFDGEIAEVQIYRRVLGDAEVAALTDGLTATYVPEPSSLLLAALGLIALAWTGRRRRCA